MEDGAVGSAQRAVVAKRYRGAPTDEAGWNRVYGPRPNRGTGNKVAHSCGRKGAQMRKGEQITGAAPGSRCQCAAMLRTPFEVGSRSDGAACAQVAAECQWVPTGETPAVRCHVGQGATSIHTHTPLRFRRLSVGAGATRGTEAGAPRIPSGPCKDVQHHT